MKKPKLIVLQPSIGSYRLGFYRSLFELCHDSYEVSVFCSLTDSNKVKTVDSLGKGIAFKNNIPCVSFGGGRLFWQPILQWLKSLEPGDVFVINGNPRYLSNIFYSIYAKLKGAKIIWWGHGWTAGGSNFNARIRFFLMRFFDHVFLYTDDEVGKYKSDIGSGVSVSALNNGINVREVRAKAKPFSVETNSHRICFIGRLEEKSDLDVLIFALHLIKRNKCLYEKIAVDVIGDGACLKAYQSRAVELGVSDKFVWHGAIWDPRVSNNILSSAAFFVYPGQVGLSVVHAFSLGLPAIVHNNIKYQMPEIGVVKNGVNGLFFDHGDVSSLASKIESMFSNRSRLFEMRKAAFDTVTVSYNTEDMAKRFYANIRSIGD